MHTYYECTLEKRHQEILVNISLCLAIASVMQVCADTSISSFDVGVAIKCSKSGPETRPTGRLVMIDGASERVLYIALPLQFFLGMR